MRQYTLAVGTICLVGLFHVPAVYFDWYFFFWWYDVMMHTLGGVAMGFLGALFWTFLYTPKEETWKNTLIYFLFVIGWVALIGIAWEWAEAIADAVVLPRLEIADAQLGLTDTMLDLYFDLFGGFCAWLVVHVICQRKK